MVNKRWKMCFNSENPLFPHKCFHTRCWGRHLLIDICYSREWRVETEFFLCCTMQYCLKPWATTAQLCGIWRYSFGTRNFVNAFAWCWTKLNYSTFQLKLYHLVLVCGGASAPHCQDATIFSLVTYNLTCVQCGLTISPTSIWPHNLQKTFQLVGKPPKTRLTWMCEIMYKAGIYCWAIHLEWCRHI